MDLMFSRDHGDYGEEDSKINWGSAVPHHRQHSGIFLFSDKGYKIMFLLETCQDQILIPFVGWEVYLYKKNRFTIHRGTEGQISVLPVDTIRVWQKAIKTEPAVQISI